MFRTSPAIVAMKVVLTRRGGCEDVTLSFRTGQVEKATTTRPTLATSSRDQIVATLVHAMAKTYKQMKEAWVSGHTGSSVADVNSVSLAMPVPYTHLQFALRA
jgi:hypothetical protein